MKENVHRGPHTLTGLMFALLNGRIDSAFLHFFIFAFHYDISK